MFLKLLLKTKKFNIYGVRFDKSSMRLLPTPRR